MYGLETNVPADRACIGESLAPSVRAGDWGNRFGETISPESNIGLISMPLYPILNQ